MVPTWEQVDVMGVWSCENILGLGGGGVRKVVQKRVDSVYLNGGVLWL